MSFLKNLFFKKQSLKPFKLLATGSFNALREEHGYYLDKTHFIPKIEALGPAILSVRPRRFGKTLFLSTLSSYYDIKNKKRFGQLFQDLYIGKNPTPLASKFLILNLNFSVLCTYRTYEIFKKNFLVMLNIDISSFMYRYKQELGNHFRVIDEKEDALINFQELLNAVELSNNKLYVCIDEYDYIINEALRNETLFQNYHKNEDNFTKNKIELIESLFKVFFSNLKTACDKGIAHVFQTGVTPITMDNPFSGFNISKDLTLKKNFWDLYGFKKLEIEFLLDKAFGNSLSDNIKEKIILWLKEENDGYFFHCKQPEGIFNITRILYCIRKLMDRKKLLDDRYSHNCDPSFILNTLLNFLPDPNTLPSQPTLDLIINNSLGRSILTEALNQRSLNSINGIEQRFQLTDIHKLATDRTSLLSFMFYTGAITYQPNLSPASLQHNFQIPNRIAKREFITTALKIYGWEKEDLIPVRNYLQILETEHNIKPLCKFIEEALLKSLERNLIKHLNEEALKQAFMDTLILTFHADIKPEFQVYSQNLYFGEKAINLIKTSTRKMIIIEFDNIKIEDVKLDRVQDSWLDENEFLSVKSDDEILNLEISEISDKYQSNQKTVREVLEWKIKEKNNKYLDPLKKQHDAELSCMFIVLRIGSYRLISKKIYCVDK